MASGQLPFLHIRRLLSRQCGNLRGNMQMRHSPLNKPLAAQMGNGACINTESLLYPIKQTDIIKLQIASLDKQATISGINNMTINRRPYKIASCFIIRHWKISLPLLFVKSVDAITLCINHIDLAHRHDELQIAIAGGCLVSGNIILGLTVIKRPLVFENQPIYVFRHHDSCVFPIILVRDTVVKSLKNAIRDIFGNFFRNEFAFRKNSNLNVANAGV